MARMLSKAWKPKLCPYGCCWSWKGYSGSGKKSNRYRESRQWRREYDV